MEVELAHARGAGDAGATGQISAQQQVLSGLLQRLHQASGAALTGLRAEAGAMVAATQAIAQQTRQSGQSAHAADMQLHKAEAHARQVTEEAARDLFERRIFDPYLRFGSAEEEAAYRKREAEREAAITKALDEGTPEGTLRANRLAIDQMKDAGAHGAAQSPEYAPMLDKLKRSGAGLEQALERAPQPLAPTAEATAKGASDAIALPPDILAALREVNASPVLDAGHGLARTEKGQAAQRERS